MLSISRLVAVCSLVALFLSSNVFAGQTLILDSAGGPGVDYTNLQAAVDGASSGDLILVRDGSYGDCVMPGKVLTICGDETHRVQIQGSMQIGGGSAQASVTLHNLELLTLGSSGKTPLAVDDWKGRLWAEECSFICESYISAPESEGHPGARIEGSHQIVLKNCMAQGGYGDWDRRAGSGLWVSDSTVAALGCEFVGEEGLEVWLAQNGWAGNGGQGLKVVESLVYLGATTCSGGPGGKVWPTWIVGYVWGGDGGDGMVIDGSSSLVEYLECVFNPGPAGIGDPTPSYDGAPGVNLRILGGARNDIGLPYRSLDLSAPVREGGPFEIRVVGVPGDFVQLLLWAEPCVDFSTIFVANGPLLIGPSLLAVSFGVIPASGLISVVFPAPQLPAGVQNLVMFAQPLIFAPTHAMLGAPSTAVLVDSAF